MTRRGVSNRPSRSGSSPAKAISVRTAVSACSRDGRGLTGVGAARTWSDRVCLGQGLTLELLFGASMTGLSVRPARCAGSVTGVAASAVGTTRRLDGAFPLLMARLSHVRRQKPFSHREFDPIYSFIRPKQSAAGHTADNPNAQ